MIVNSHPILAAMEQAPFRFHLIGSRFVGVFSEKSDYDFIAEINKWEEWDQLKTWMSAQGFKSGSPSGYGPDRRLYNSDIWTWKGNGDVPPVDILPMSTEEATMRLRWFTAMKSEGDETGLIAKALKGEKAWPLLWSVLTKYAK